ncbi:hypothetical protein [Paenibacillus alba]|uniref:Uncharacterized protein n=1 Tax=Paenibacillus alba TaxID=1197127 RepID=A0ABU6G2W3_9BACL|nr:hypothetical protein [Paenibacillus alba]MEC0227109.1 hypothetical protein [Paenibacillus alba]
MLIYDHPAYFPYPLPLYRLYVIHPTCYAAVTAPSPLWNRDFPPIDTKILHHSVASSQALLKDAALITAKLSEPAIAHQMMTHAQTGDQKEVDRIVHTFGCESAVITSFTPSAVHFTIDPRTNGKSCCEVTLSMKWGL